MRQSMLLCQVSCHQLIVKPANPHQLVVRHWQAKVPIRSPQSLPDSAGTALHSLLDAGVDGLEKLDTLDLLTAAHAQWQQQMLDSLSTNQTVQSLPAAVVVVPGHHAPSWLPPLVTGYVLALATKRILLVESDGLLQYVQLPFPASWKAYSKAYSAVDSCMRLTCSPEDRIERCGSQQGTLNSFWSNKLIIYTSQDYDVPLLRSNPRYKPFFDRYFPHGEVFHAVTNHLLKPSPSLLEAMQPYMINATNCVVGLQVLHNKAQQAAHPHVSHLRLSVGVAYHMSGGGSGLIYVATERREVMRELVGLLEEQRLRWYNCTPTHPRDMTVVIDMFMLSKCKHIIVSSSMGAVAAGIAGVKPVYVGSVYPQLSATSEPCMFRAAQLLQQGDHVAARFRMAFPLYVVQSQCHR